MSLIAKAQATPASIGGAPYNISVFATGPLNTPRIFWGVGAPSASTLLMGNNKFNGLGSGFIVNASIVNGGAGYVVGQKITDGTISIIVDQVDVNGAILDYHVSAIGFYAAYPANPFNVNGGAQFNLNWPAPDIYFDITNLAAPVAYVCFSAGDVNSSKWVQFGGSGGSGYIGEYDGAAHGPGTICRVTIGNGSYGLFALPPSKSAAAGQAPVFPEVANNPWQCIGLPFNTIGTCSGGSKTIYIQSSAPFQP